MPDQIPILSLTPPTPPQDTVQRRAKPTQVEIIRRYDAETFFDSIIQTFLASLLVMLIFGALHRHYPVVPLISYWDTFLGLTGLSLIVNECRPTHRIWRKKEQGR